MEGGLTSAGGAGVSGGRLRPLGVGETLDHAIKLYRSNAVALWEIVAMVIIPVEIIEVILRRISLPSDVFLRSGTLYTHTGASNAGATVALLVVALLGLLGELLATGAVFKLQLDAYLGKPHHIRESFEFASSRVLSLLWVGQLSTILIAVGFILVIIPGVWLVVSVSVAIPALMLEGVKGFAALRRSMNLVRGRWWATLGRLIVAFLLYGIVIGVVDAIAGGIANGVTNVTLYLVINGAVSAIGVILLSPFIAAVINVIYIDLRVRKEALDIELLASGFAAPSGIAAPGQAPDVAAAAAAAGLEHPSSPWDPGASSAPTWPPPSN